MNSNSNIQYRPASSADTKAMFELFVESVTDLGERLGVMTIDGGDDPETLNNLWESRRSLVEHLTKTAEYCYLAECDGIPLGYARTIKRDDILQLTDFFVSPSTQSSGVGRDLLERAFPSDDKTQRRIIIATFDTRAQARYLKSGVYPLFPIYFFQRKPEAIAVKLGNLETELLRDTPEHLSILNKIDTHILEYTREIDHRWLIQNRNGYLYYQDGQAVGYAYLGKKTGPITLLDAANYPTVLRHAENEAAKQSKFCGIDVPGNNREAISYLLKRGFKIDPFITFFMADKPFGQFENYIFSSPPFFT